MDDNKLNFHAFRHGLEIMSDLGSSTYNIKGREGANEKVALEVEGDSPG